MNCLSAECTVTEEGRLAAKFDGSLSEYEISERLRFLKEYFRWYRTREEIPCVDGGTGREGLFSLEPLGAFGSGIHDTTRGCVELIRRYSRKRAPDGIRVLDLGTGTGILSLFCHSVGMRDITAVDNSLRAVISAFHNFSEKQPCSDITLKLGSLDRVSGQFDLVIANILFPVISELFDGITERTAPGGEIIFSGIKKAEDDAMRKMIYRCRILEMNDTLESGGWMCYSVRLIR